MYRLTITFCILAQAFAQQEPVGKKIADPAAAASPATADGALYELMKAEYLAEACEDAGWGPFPNASSTSLTAEAYARAHGTSGCKCGMLYGLAHSSLSHEDDVAAMSRAVQGPARCSGGSAAGFPCDGVDLIAHLPLSAFRTSARASSPSAASRRGCSSSSAPSVVACAAPAYELAIALRPPRPLFPGGTVANTGSRLAPLSISLVLDVSKY